MKNIVFKLFTVAILYTMAASALAEDKLVDSNFYKHEFSVLWQSHIERDLEIKHFEEKLIPNKSAKTLYRTWVMNACTIPGKEHYYNVKPGYGSPAEISPVIYGPPEIEGKPILPLAEGISLMLLIKHRHEHLHNCACNYVREPSGKIHESAKKAIVEMCGAEAIARLDASMAKRKQTELAEVSSPDVNWYYTAFKSLWASHIDRDPSLQFVEQRLIKDHSAKLAYKAWLTNICTTPGDEQSINGLQAPNTTALFHKAPIVYGKPILDQAETLHVNDTVKSNRFKLATNFREYVYTDSNEKRAKAKENLVEMCGVEAVERLDTKIAERNAETTETNKSNR